MPDARVICGDCLTVMRDFAPGSFDLTVTSPPYDDLREYGGYTFDFEGIATQLLRVTKDGGVVVWIVNDQTIDGDESGTSFRQALYFKSIGFKLHDTMIWHKPGASNPSVVRYNQTFEYMFILAKGTPVTFNGLRDRRNKWRGRFGAGTVREWDGSMAHTKVDKVQYGEFGLRDNVWNVLMANQENICQPNAHPAMFSKALARDHVLSWSNPGDKVLDSMCGSGTTGVACAELGRDFVGIELDAGYCEIARKRIDAAMRQGKLFAHA